MKTAHIHHTASVIFYVPWDYEKTLGWLRGPHHFVDEDDILGMTPLTQPGTHAVSFNSSSIGIEMLGDYDTENPKSGRGLAVCRTGAAAARPGLGHPRS